MQKTHEVNHHLMDVPTLKTADNHHFVLNGKLTFDTVPLLWKNEQPTLLKALSPITIDLSNVHHSDSSGAALLVAWIRAARRQNKKIKFVNLPQQMQALFQVTGLEKIFLS